MISTKLVTMFSLAALLSPALAQQPNGPASSYGQAAGPGAITYVEGQAAVDGRELSVRNGGLGTLAPGQTLATSTGKAEVMIGPGVFLRLDSDTEVKMVSPAVGRGEVALDRGRAAVEMDFVPPYGDKAPVRVDLAGGSEAGLLERGLYEFDANAGLLKVYDGKAQVFLSEASNKHETIKGGHELALNGSETKAVSFDKNISGDSLLAFNDQRSRTELASNGYARGYGDGYGPYGDGPVYGYPAYPYPLNAGFYGPYYGYPFYPAFYGGFYRGGFGGRFRR